MRKALVIILLITLAVHAAAEKKSSGLFPRQDYVKKHSVIFFKKVNTNQPLISKVDFFIRSEAYLSAYIELAVFISKNDYFNELLLKVEKDREALIEQFNANKKDLQIETCAEYQKKMGVDNLTYYLLALHALVNDYRNNALSGDDAFKLWNIVLELTEWANKEGGKNIENVALLTVSSHMVFFKDYTKWGKRAQKALKKIDLKTVTDKDALLILGK